jgi:hypothetical protein
VIATIDCTLTCKSARLFVQFLTCVAFPDVGYRRRKEQKEQKWADTEENNRQK